MRPKCPGARLRPTHMPGATPGGAAGMGRRKSAEGPSFVSLPVGDQPARTAAVRGSACPACFMSRFISAPSCYPVGRRLEEYYRQNNHNIVSNDIPPATIHMTSPSINAKATDRTHGSGELVTTGTKLETRYKNKEMTTKLITNFREKSPFSTSSISILSKLTV